MHKSSKRLSLNLIHCAYIGIEFLSDLRILNNTFVGSGGSWLLNMLHWHYYYCYSLHFFYFYPGLLYEDFLGNQLKPNKIFWKSAHVKSNFWKKYIFGYKSIDSIVFLYRWFYSWFTLVHGFTVLLHYSYLPHCMSKANQALLSYFYQIASNWHHVVNLKFWSFDTC